MVNKAETPRGAKMFLGAGLQGGRILCSRWSVWAQERNEGMGWLGPELGPSAKSLSADVPVPGARGKTEHLRETAPSPLVPSPLGDRQASPV